MKKLVTFTAQWCGSCKMLKPILAALADENLIELQIVDIDDQRAHAAQMGVRSVPALFFYNDDMVYEQSVGFMPREKVLEIYNREIAAPEAEVEVEVEVVDSLGEDLEVDIVAEVEKEEEVIFTPPHTIFDEQPEEELVVEEDAEDIEPLV